MKYRRMISGAVCALLAALTACEEVLVQVQEPPVAEQPSYVSLEEVARLLSSLPLETAQMEEVHDAVSASAGNGYDEEYRMLELFQAPGSGVGDNLPTRAHKYARPLRELFREALVATKADEASDWLEALSASDVQIYWPFSASWTGDGLPVVTFDPGDGADRNQGYALCADGTVQSVMVDEQMASERPVWVVNRNSDADYKSLELLRREDPSWGSGGGDIVVKGSQPDIKTLVLRSFTAHRQYDSWFAGASEFFVKMGSVEDFIAGTEAELRLYDPSITDFMIVVRRSQVGEELPFNAVLVSEWTKQLTSCAFMMIEDDGGTRTTWKCNAMVKIESKSYGFELEIPLYSRDDIVWRGSLTRNYIEKNNGTTVRYGDVSLVLELI